MFFWDPQSSAVFPNLHIFKLYLIKHNWINSSAQLVETPTPEIDWSDKEDIQNV